ncbi:MAG: hypothetical protein AAFY56_04710 [Pseudomonadota bacterium]
MTLNEEEIRLAEGLRHSYVRRYRPEDQLEREMVENLVILQLKMRRLDRLELEAMDRAFDVGTNEPEVAESPKKYPSLETLGRYRSRLLKEQETTELRLSTLLSQRPNAQSAGQSRSKAEPVEEAKGYHIANDDRFTENRKNEPAIPSNGEPCGVSATLVA